MRGPAVLLHVLGVAMWLGGGFASMAARKSDPRLLAVLHQRIISPGVIVVLVSGFYLSSQVGPGAMDRAGILGMVASGVVGGLVTLFVGLPTAMRRARAAEGELASVVAMLGKRQAIVMTVGGVLGLTALGFVYLG